MSNPDAQRDTGAVLTTNVLASSLDEAYAKARLDARAFFGEGIIRLHLVEAETVTAPRNAHGEAIARPQFACKFTARRDEPGTTYGGPTELNVVRLEDVAAALAAFRLGDFPDRAVDRHDLSDASFLIEKLGERGYRIVRKDGH